MVGRAVTVLVLTVLGCCGCHGQRAMRSVADSLIAQPDPTVELLESELRWMEDNLYHLDGQLDKCLRQLESTRRTNAALRLKIAELEQQPAAQGTGPLDPPSIRSQPQVQYDEEFNDNTDRLLDFTPKVELGAALSGHDENGGTPDSGNTFELPPNSVPAAPSTPPQAIPGSVPADRPVIESPERPSLDDDQQDDQQGTSNSGQVFRIQLNERLTGGYNADHHPGHDGVMVVIEPQDAGANYLPVAGAVNIELREKNRSGIAGLVGTWKFTQQETKARTKQTRLGKGIHLELPWPQGSPTTERLELAVQYRAPDGRVLRAAREILIEPTTSALTTQADVAEQKSWYSQQPRTASRWQPTR